MVCVQSGYKTITPVEIANCLQAWETGEISYQGLRVYFGSFAMQAIREAARRSARRKGRRPMAKPRYRVSEVCGLTGLSDRTVKRELRSLTGASLVGFSEHEIVFHKAPLVGSEKLCKGLAGKRSSRRPIPVPRSVLRFIARSSRPAMGLTMLAYVMRGMVIERNGGEVKGAGTVKASWVAQAFGLSLRSVKGARKRLIAMGFISKDIASTQRKLNRDGSYFRINLEWNEKVGDSDGLPVREKIAPPLDNSCASFAPPYKDKKTSTESKNQETQKSSGVLKTNSRQGKDPRLSDVKLEDLKNFFHLEILFQQAVKAGWLGRSEANFLNWIAASVRARTVAARDPVRVFVSLVKNGRWNFITQEQEDRARVAIKRFREIPVSDQRPVQATVKPVERIPTPVTVHGLTVSSATSVKPFSKIKEPLSEILERLEARKIIEKSFPEIKLRLEL